MDPDDVRLLRRRLGELHRQQRRETPPIAGISHSAARVLGAVSRTDGVARPNAIAAELVMASSNVATALRELETVGLVVREAAHDDRRAVTVRLTEAGDAAVTAHRNGRDTWLAAAIDAELFPAEQAELLAAARLLERIARYEPDARG